MFLVAVTSCDRNSPDHFKKGVRNALSGKGMAVGAFRPETTYPGATEGRQKVECATVSRNDADCRICLVVYNESDVAIRVANMKFHDALPEGSLFCGWKDHPCRRTRSEEVRHVRPGGSR
jgi:hypothetical protein